MTFKQNLFLKTACFLLFIFFIQFVICQENNNLIIQDSLKSKSYKELNTLSVGAYKNSNEELLHIYRAYHLKKAKQENNPLEIARAYYNFISWEDFEKDITYCDSMINITRNSTHKAYPTNGYLIKANLYYNNLDYSKALDNFIITNELATEKQDKMQQIDATNGIAAIKNVWGLHDEALEIYKTNYADIISTPDYIIDLYDDYMILANNLSLSYIRNHKADSALAISENGMKVAQMAKDTNNYYDLGKIRATANFYLKNYSQALDSLVKLSSVFSGFHLADNYYMMAKIHGHQNNRPQAIFYYKKIDSIHSSINDPFPELKEVYNELYKHARNQDDKEMQLYYVEQLIDVDSILDFNYADIGDKMRTDYDIPKLKKEKLILKKELNSKQKILIVTVGVVIILCAFVIYYYVRQRRFKKRLQQLLKTDTVKTVTLEPTNPNTPAIGISDDIVKDILQKLKAFEYSKKYVKQDITLHALAKDFKTNSSYLSLVINNMKQTNFSTYLKDLRITNAINNIKKNNKFLKYSINGLAEEFGFSTSESFSKTFKEKTGIKPSYFLEELRKNKSNGGRNL